MIVFGSISQKEKHCAWQVGFFVGKKEWTPNRLVLPTHQQQSELFSHGSHTVSVYSKPALDSHSRNLSKDFVTVGVVFSLLYEFSHEWCLYKLGETDLVRLNLNSLWLGVVLSVHFKLSRIFKLFHLSALLNQHLLVLLVLS